MSTEKSKQMTDCGLLYEHDPHVYKTPKGAVKACDGAFRESKTQ